MQARLAIRAGQRELERLLNGFAPDDARALADLDRRWRTTLDAILPAQQALEPGPVADRLVDVTRALQQRFEKQRRLAEENLHNSQRAQLLGSAPAPDHHLAQESVALDLSLHQIDGTLDSARETVASLQNQKRVLAKLQRGAGRAIAQSAAASALMGRIQSLQRRHQLIILAIAALLVFTTLFYAFNFK